MILLHLRTYLSRWHDVISNIPAVSRLLGTFECTNSFQTNLLISLHSVMVSRVLTIVANYLDG